MTTVPLNQSNSVVLDASGNGTARLGPVGAREAWNVGYIHVKTNQAPGDIVNEAQCFVYSGPEVADEYFVDSTSSGSTGDSTDSGQAYAVTLGEYIWAVWQGGDPGAQGIVRVTGSKEI